MPKKASSDQSSEQNALAFIRQIALQNVNVGGDLKIGSINQTVYVTQPKRLSVIVDETHPPSDGWQERPEQEQILRVLHSKQARLIGISGAGGFGKSALADQICKQVESFQAIWINFREPYPFRQFARWVLENKLDYQIDKELTDQELAVEVLNHLSKKRLLLVLDNLETLFEPGERWNAYRHFLGEWLSIGGEGSILITSREQIPLPEENAPGGCRWFPLQGLPVNKGIALLRNADIQGTTANLQKFVELAGGHPLLLKLAISWLHNPERQEHSRNIISLTKDQIDLFSQLVGPHRGNEEASVGALFAESFNQLSERLQKLLVGVATYRLPFNLNAAQSILPNENIVENDLRLLVRQSLLLRQSQEKQWKFEFHPLIKRYLQTDQILEDGQVYLHWRAILYYQSVAKSSGWKTQEDVAEYLEVFYHLCELKQYPQAFDFLINSGCDDFLQLRGYNSIRAELYAPLVQQWQPNSSSEDKSSYAKMLNCLGFAYQILGEYEKARISHESAQRISQSIGDQAGEAEALEGLGDAFNSLKQYEGADEFYKRAEKIKRQLGDIVGANDILLNLANFRTALRQCDDSLLEYERSFTYSRQANDRHSMAKLRNEIGKIYQNIGQHSEAIKNYQQALKIYQEFSHSNNQDENLNPKKAQIFRHLGDAYRRLSQHQESAINYQQALNIFRETGRFVEEAETLVDLGVAYSELGKYSEAIDSCQQALRVFQSHNLRQSELNAWNSLGIIYLYQNKYLKAREHFQKALEISNEVGSKKYTLLSNLGFLSYIEKQFKRAIRYYRQSLEANPSEEPYKEVLARSRLASAYRELAQEYFNRAEYSVAIDLFQRALDFFTSVEARCLTSKEQQRDQEEKKLAQQQLNEARQRLNQSYQATADFLRKTLADKRASGDLPGVAEALLGLGNVYHSMGKYKEAQDFYRQALEIFQTIPSSKGLEGVANVWLGLSRIDCSLKEYKKAIQFIYQETLPRFEELDGSDGSNGSVGKVNSLNTLGYANHGLNKYEEAIRWYTEALTTSKDIDARLGEADAQNGLGAAYSSLGQYQKATELLNQALTTRKELCDRAGEGDTRSNFGNLNFLQANYEQAVKFYEEALAILQAIGHAEFIAKALEGLKRARAAQNNKQESSIPHWPKPTENNGISDQSQQETLIIQDTSKSLQLNQLTLFFLLNFSGAFLLTYLTMMGVRWAHNSFSFLSIIPLGDPSPSFSPSPSPTPTAPSPTPTSTPLISTTPFGHRVFCPPDRVNAEGLNMRKSPGLSAPIISLIPCSADGVEVLGRARMVDGECWVPVQYQTTQGWVVRRFLSGSTQYDE